MTEQCCCRTSRCPVREVLTRCLLKADGQFVLKDKGPKSVELLYRRATAKYCSSTREFADRFGKDAQKEGFEPIVVEEKLQLFLKGR